MEDALRNSFYNAKHSSNKATHTPLYRLPLQACTKDSSSTGIRRRRLGHDATDISQQGR